MAMRAVVQLLDSAQGHPLQTWTFEDREKITIGRSDENDIIVADPYVSRSHAYLQYENGRWRLNSVSQNQIVFQGESVSELRICEGTSFRLGRHGCFLRFGQSNAPSADPRTIIFEPTLMPIFNLDREKLQSEVNQIAGGSYFQKLKDAAKKLRDERQTEEKKE